VLSFGYPNLYLNFRKYSMNFSDFNLKPELLKGLEALGYKTPTPIQEKTIPLLMQNKDVIGCAQTGTGKTAAFAVPILNRIQTGNQRPQVLIITPTRELAEQIDVAIKDYSRFMRVRSAAIYGGVKSGPQENAIRRGLDIVVATPGRLLDHLRNRVLNLSQIQFLVLDEADRMLDMGFMPDIKRIVAQLPVERQTLLYSATMPPEIEKVGRSLTKQAELILAGPRNTTAHSVRQVVYKVEKSEKLRLLVHVLQHGDTGSTIVFSRTRHGADRIAKQLGRQGIEAARIHADRSQSQRLAALENFRQGRCQVLVATDIAARGLDIENVTHVINYDTPTHAEDYVHRIGRTGRAAATGDALTFTSMDEDKYLRSIEKLIGKPLPITPKPAQMPVLISPPPPEPGPRFSPTRTPSASGRGSAAFPPNSKAAYSGQRAYNKGAEFKAGRPKSKSQAGYRSNRP
jgi:ATP-dependent RNA helicase RhlE